MCNIYSRSNFNNFFQAALGRLRVLRLTPSHTYINKKVNEFGKDYDKKLIASFQSECARLKEKSETGVSEIEIDPGFKHVIDNFNMRKSVCDMTESHQNINENWVTHLVVRNRISDHALSTTVERDIFEMSNGDVLPNHYDHRSQMKNYITLIQRILVERIPCFAAMKPHVLYHIPHKHSKEAKEKAENVCIYCSFYIFSICCQYMHCTH